MAFDVFQYIPPVDVPVNLFPTAATAGYNAGLAVPSETTAIIEGITEGIKTGQSITLNNQAIEENRQQSEIRQNQIEQLPIANEMQRVQLENAQKINEINELRLKLEQDTYQYKVQNELDTLKEQAAEFEEAKRVRTTKERVGQYLTSTDPQVRRKVLQDPEAMDLMLNDSKYGEAVLGRLSGTGALTKAEEDNLFKQINYTRAKELEAARLKQLDAAVQKELQKFDELETKVNSDPQITNSLSAAGVKNYAELIDSDVRLVPTGQTTYIKENGKETNVVDKYAAPGAALTTQSGKPISYDLIVNGKKSPVVINSEESAANLNKILYLSRAKFGYSAAAAAEKEAPNVQPTEQAPAAAPTSIDPTIAALEQQGFRKEDISPVMEAGIAQGTAPGSWLTDALDKILPDSNIVDATAVTDFYESQQIKDIRKVINTTAARATDEILKVLDSNDSAKKQELRDWAETNGVKLSELSLNKYFRDKLRTELSDAYEKAVEFGEQQQAAKAREANAKDAMKARLRGADPREVVRGIDQLQPNTGSTPEPNKTQLEPTAATSENTNASLVQTAADQMQTAKNLVDEAYIERNVMQNLEPKLKELGAKYGLPKDYTDKLYDNVVRVENNEYMKGQPPHIKAVAAVESGGRTNAKSGTGVRGLMQVTKLVADMYGKDRNDPQENIEAGALYLEDLIKQFKGSKALAYAAYNAGPGVIRHAQKLAGGSYVWSEVKPYLLEALTKFRHVTGWKPSIKLQEVYNYPEKVALHEELFMGDVADTGVTT